MDWNSLSESNQGMIFFFTLGLAAASPAFFREYCSFNIWPGVIRQTIVVWIVIFMLPSDNQSIEYPELMIGIAIVLTIITLYINVQECGAVAGTGALLAQSALGFYIIIALAILFILYILSRGNRKNGNH